MEGDEEEIGEFLGLRPVVGVGVGVVGEGIELVGAVTGDEVVTVGLGDAGGGLLSLLVLGEHLFDEQS